MDWITDRIAIGAFDESAPEGAAVLDLRGIPDHCRIEFNVFRWHVRMINTILDEGRKVFVHCIGGVSRSPTIVAAWLALSEDITGRQALVRIKAQRKQIIPHPDQVASLEDFLDAERA